MEEIAEELKEMNYDEFTLKYISNFIIEFEQVLGQYMSREVLIDRIKKNLLKITPVDRFERKRLLGSYLPSKKEIRVLNSLDEDNMKSVLFHELIHMLRQTVKENDFIGILKEEKGLDEGFTEYVTQKRNKFFGIKGIRAYPILTKQIENLANIIGEEDIIISMLYDTEIGDVDEEVVQGNNSLTSAMQKNGFDRFKFSSDLDIIWEYEDLILNSNSPEEILIRSIFGEGPAKDDAMEAQFSICKMFVQQPISTADDFLRRFETAKEYAMDLGMTSDMSKKTVLFLYDEYCKHPEYKEKIPSEFKQYFEDMDFVTTFLQMSFDEKMQVLSEDQEFNQRICQSEISDTLKKRIVESFEELNHLGPSKQIYTILTTGGIAKKIVNKEMVAEELAIEWIDEAKEMCNLYISNDSEVKYIETLSFCDDYMREYKPADKGQIPQKIMDLIDEDGEILINGDDFLLVSSSGEWRYAFIDDDELLATKLCDETEYCESYFEKLNLQYLALERRVKRLKDLKAPKILYRADSEKIKEIEEKLVELKSKFSSRKKKGSIEPYEIEEEAERQGISDIDIQKMIKSIGSRTRELKESSSLFLDILRGDEHE